MKKRNYIVRWLLVILVLAMVVTGLVVVIKEKFLKEPEGTFMLRDDAYLLYTYLYGVEDSDGQTRVLEPLASVSANHTAQNGEASYLTLREAKLMLSLLGEHYPVYGGEIEKLSQNVFLGNHGEDSFLLADEFLDCFAQLFAIIYPDKTLAETEQLLLGTGGQVKNLDDTTLSGNSILLAEKDEKGQISTVREYHMTERFLQQKPLVREDLYVHHVYLTVGDLVLTDVSAYRTKQQDNQFELPACFISSNQPDALWLTTGNYQICIQSGTEGIRLADGTLYDTFEDVADIFFEDGKIKHITTYEERVSGKLLSVSDERIELEGMGFYPYRENLPVYKLYGQREPYTKSDLKIGYDFTDFVLDQNGEIVAGLVTREEKMESIRIVIKTTGFASAYHETITLTCDSDFLVNEERHMAGEEVTVSMDDARLNEGRIYIRPETNLARTSVTSIERDQGIPSYRGNFEIAKAADGLLLINELLLEEYLYSVVPSEMPAGYPMEALKAQAISARTYAYERMLNSGLKEYGAHVDDSAAFQVYNNIKESENTTLAIRETQGQLAAFGEDLAETYYYSTSCGYGTDIGAWHSSLANDYSYLASRHISKDAVTGDAVTGDAEAAAHMEITDEETFRNYITTVSANDFEAAEGWYRWKYDTALNVDRLNENLVKRYEASEKSILIPDENGAFIPGEPPKFTQVVRLAVVKRESGGVIDELLIEGKEGYVKVVGEHAVRSVLANDGAKVIRQDGSESSVAALLPSAFAVIDVQIDSSTNSIVAYTVTGGGYGHGIGMSQNGAKAMALSGMNCNDILQFFYQGISIRNINE